MSRVSVNDMVKTLQTTPTYSGLTKHDIDKELKSKYNLSTIKKADYARAKLML